MDGFQCGRTPGMQPFAAPAFGEQAGAGPVAIEGRAPKAVWRRYAARLAGMGAAG